MESFYEAPVAHQEPEPQQQEKSFLEKFNFRQPSKVAPLDKPQFSKQDEFEGLGDDVIKKIKPGSNE